MKTTIAASRLISLIMLLQRQPNQKAADLARDLDVSVRTLHRYLAMLGEMGIPVYSERGPQGGFSLVRGYRMPPLIFTPQEAAAVMLGTGLVCEMWGDLYAEEARAAQAKLENVLPEDQLDEVSWARRSLFSLGVHHPALAECAETLEQIRDALRARRRVRMTYRAASTAAPVEREVSPYTLAHSRGWWYLIGHCHLRDAVRTFRIDRINALAPLPTPAAEIPPNFDPRPYLSMENIQPGQIVCRMRFHPDFASLAALSRGLWQSEEKHPDGTLIVTFSMPSLEWAASVVLSYGGAAFIEEPEPLRRMVADWAGRIVSQYAPVAGA